MLNLCRRFHAFHRYVYVDRVAFIPDSHGRLRIVAARDCSVCGKHEEIDFSEDEYAALNAV